MQRCKTCGLVLSADARICGRCGQAVVAGSPMLGTLVGQGQPPVAKMPMVRGITQVDDVPMVQGRPSTLPRHMGSPAPAQHPSTSPDLHIQTTGPHLSYPPTPSYHWHRNQRPKVPTARWLMIMVASIVIIVSIIGGLALLLPPIISLSTNVVHQGDTLSM